MKELNPVTQNHPRSKLLLRLDEAAESAGDARLSLSPQPEPVAVKDETEIEPLVVSLTTAARLLVVSDRHIRSHLHEIPHIRFGGRLLFRVDSLRQFLAEREQVAK